MTKTWPAQNFDRNEFACRCGCGGNTVDAELLAVLETIREELGDHPIKIVSGFRCQRHNAAVGGAKSSKHLLGKAADIIVQGITPGAVYAFIAGRWMDKFGVGSYDSFTHIDVRSHRWRG